MSNLPKFATDIAATRVRTVRMGSMIQSDTTAHLDRVLIASETRKDRFVGCARKIGGKHGRWQIEVYADLMTKTQEPVVITTDRARSLLAAISKCRVLYAHHWARAQAAKEPVITGHGVLDTPENRTALGVEPRRDPDAAPLPATPPKPRARRAAKPTEPAAA